jgi:hypothetical protein
MKTRESIAMLHQMRTRRAILCNPERLTKELVGLLNKYATRHPGTTEVEMLSALELSWDVVRQSADWNRRAA